LFVGKFKIVGGLLSQFVEHGEEDDEQRNQFWWRFGHCKVFHFII